MAAIFAAFLQILPSVDSAQGSLAVGATLPLLAALAVFGLGMSVWRDMRIAATGALLLSFTYLYPYFPQIWSGWPLVMSLILVMGVWSVALEYLAQPLLAWSVLVGLSVGAIVLVHGSELLTVIVVLPLLLLSTGLRGVDWRRLMVALA